MGLYTFVREFVNFVKETVWFKLVKERTHWEVLEAWVLVLGGWTVLGQLCDGLPGPFLGVFEGLCAGFACSDWVYLA